VRRDPLTLGAATHGTGALASAGPARVRPTAGADGVPLWIDPSARPSASPLVESLAVFLGCVIVALARGQVRMNACCEAL
jgi:hypothetical protein